MNDDLDPLEQELAGLKPREPSPELRRRTHQQLSGSDSVGDRLPRAIALFIAGAVTALVILMLILQDAVPLVTTSRRVPPVPPTMTMPDESQPTLQAYRRAMSHSPEEFDALLDKQGASSGVGSTSFHAFSRTEFASSGEP